MSKLTSPSFEDGGAIPEKYGHDTQNINPPLSITTVPQKAESLTLIMDDPDSVAPAGEIWLHWLVWNIPPSKSEIPAGWEPTTAVEGTNDFGNRGYGGPAPPRQTTHLPVQTLRPLRNAFPRTIGERAVGTAMQDNRLSQTQLEGTYAP